MIHSIIFTVMPTSRTDAHRNVDDGFRSPNPFDSASDSEEESTAENNISRIRQYENGFRDYEGIHTKSDHELENNAVYKAEKATEKVNDCLKIAEDIKEDAAKILVTLHQQGEQISRTHLSVVNVDHDLSRVCFSFLFFIGFSSCKIRCHICHKCLCFYLFICLVSEPSQCLSRCFNHDLSRACFSFQSSSLLPSLDLYHVMSKWVDLLTCV